MADDDFDIDIYGDERMQTSAGDELIELDLDEPQTASQDLDHPPTKSPQPQDTQQSQAAAPSAPAAQGDQPPTPAQSEGTPVEGKPPGATALRMNELHWWVTEDDVRSWINACQLETEVVEIAFAEHKENGKSKGYVMLQSHLLERDSHTQRGVGTSDDTTSHVKSPSTADDATRPVKVLQNAINSFRQR